MTRDEGLRRLCEALTALPRHERASDAGVRLFLRFTNAAGPAEVLALLDERDAARAWARRWKHEAKERLRSQRDSLNDATELLARSTEDRDALAARVAVLEGAAGAVVRAWERHGTCLDEFGAGVDGLMACGEYADRLNTMIVELRRALAAPAGEEGE